VAAGNVIPVQKAYFVAGGRARAVGLGSLNLPPAYQSIPFLPASDQLDGLPFANKGLGVVALHVLAQEPEIERGAAGIKTTQKIEPSL
jgi:hypothetical protein